MSLRPVQVKLVRPDLKNKQKINQQTKTQKMGVGRVGAWLKR
jgi:hypothetical protein